MRPALVGAILALAVPGGPAWSDPPPAPHEAAPSEASLVVWASTPSAEQAARALSDRAAERGVFEVVDAGLVRRRVAAGSRVDVESFLGEVRRNVAAARASLGTGDPQGALDRLEPPLRDFLADLADPEGRETLRDLLVVRARALIARNDPVAASADVTLAVRLDPRAGAAGSTGIELTSLLPAERALFDRAVQDAGVAGNGHLSLDSEPTGAAAVVDGVARGTTPLELDLPYGRHVVRTERFGRQPVAQIVDVAAGQTATARLALPETEGEDLLEQIAVRVGRGDFEAGNPDALAVLARALGVRAVLVVEAGPRIRARLFRAGSWAASGSADVAGPWDELLARFEQAALGRTGRAPGETAPEAPTPITGRWWFWTGIGAVVVGGVVTGIVLATQEDPRGVVRWGRP